MGMAGVFAVMLFLLVVIGDWVQFTSLRHSGARYGCCIAKGHEEIPISLCPLMTGVFHADGALSLPHGIARLFQEDRHILLRPTHRLFSFRFRTAWPLKGSIELTDQGSVTQLALTKRIPWSSAIVTFTWFLVVLLGTLGFVIAYVRDGGMSSLLGMVMGVGIVGLGALVLGVGVITVSLAYRVENDRLMQTYQELRDAIGKQAFR